jgi:hypothetical protein
MYENSTGMLCNKHLVVVVFVSLHKSWTMQFQEMGRWATVHAFAMRFVVDGFGTSLGGGAYYHLPMWVCKPRTRLIIQRYLTTWLGRVVLVGRYFQLIHVCKSATIVRDVSLTAEGDYSVLDSPQLCRDPTASSTLANIQPKPREKPIGGAAG